jgi:hypothetical protein
MRRLLRAIGNKKPIQVSYVEVSPCSESKVPISKVVEEESILQEYFEVIIFCQFY